MKLKKQWEEEPDYETFTHLGYQGIIKRQPQLLTLCGYIGVPQSHPFYGRDYDSVYGYLDCHGGLTFSGQFPDFPHWFFGFDCAHAGDLIPSTYQLMNELREKEDCLSTSIFFQRDVYRNFDYVKKHVIQLANQLRDDRIRHLVSRS